MTLRKFIPLAAVALALSAQEKQQAKPAPPEAVQEPKPAAPEAQQVEPVRPAAAEQKLTGTLDFGYRWVSDLGGSQNTYRSIVNLGEGPKLFQGSAAYRDPQGKFLDKLDLQAASWGGDPYNTGRLEASLTGVYALQMDYRNVAYFNSLSSFANPLLASGLLLSERALDLRRRSLDTQLDLRPGARVSPFLALSHGAGFGRGVTTFVTDGNEFPVATDLRDSTESYRGGAHLNFSRFTVTLEQGGATFKDDQQIFVGRSGNRGNRPTAGLVLDDLRQAYGARGSGLYERAAIQARPWSKLSFNGQFLYSQPSIDVRYLDQSKGNFLLLQALAPYTALSESELGEAKRPHSSGSWSTELRPWSRLRIVQSWYSDRFHVSAASLLSQSFNTTPATNLDTRAFDLLVLNYNQHQVEAIVEAASFLTLRGGHRYGWGDATVRNPEITRTPGPSKFGELRRQVALAGATLRRGATLDVSFDFEASPGDQAFFRTDLMQYQRGKVRARYRLRPSLTLTGSFVVLNNRNPARDVRFDLRSQQSSLSLFWTPNQGRRVTIVADYSRATLRSDLPTLVPQTFDTELNPYRDKGHHGGGYADLNLARGARLSFGGYYSINAGSRPTRYYQPQARFRVPLRGKLVWTSEWRWFGFTERQHAFENFHTHTFSTGFQIGL